MARQASFSPRRAASDAELVLEQARVLTLDPRRPRAEAVALAAGKILAVGTLEEIRPCITRRTRRLACGWRTVLPGFIDPHLHLFAWASRLCGAELGSARSIFDIQHALKTQLGKASRTGWLRGYGYDEFFLSERRHPNRYDLDAVVRVRPIILRHRSGHAAVLNSLALQRAGITDGQTPHGATVERDEHGKPTGVVYESEPLLRAILPPPDPATFETGLRMVNRALLQHGVCGFHDAGAGNTLGDVRRFSRLCEQGVLRPRARVMLGTPAFFELLRGDQEEEIRSTCPSTRVKVGSIKIMLHEGRGHLDPPLDELTELVWRVHRHGFQVAIHAVEEAPICAALDAIQCAQRRLPRTDHRHRIEHCALCPPPFLDSLAEAGVSLVTQPGFLHFYGDKYLDEVDRDVHAWLYRTKSFLERGILVTASSDCPVGPQNPWPAVQAAVTRRSQSGAVVNAAEGVPLSQALALFTSAAARVGFEERHAGRLAPGLRADVVVLNSDVTRLAPVRLSEVKVDTTIIDGQPVYSA